MSVEVIDEGNNYTVVYDKVRALTYGKKDLFILYSWNPATHEAIGLKTHEWGNNRKKLKEIAQDYNTHALETVARIRKENHLSSVVAVIPIEYWVICISGQPQPQIRKIIGCDWNTLGKYHYTNMVCRK